MGSEFVVVVDVLAQDASQVLLVEHDDVIEAFASERANHALGDRIRLGCAHWRLDGLDADLRCPQRGY